MTDAKTLTTADLRQFTGTEQWHRHGIVRDALFTNGAKYVADQAGAYWLLDEIALAQRGSNRVAGEAFQLWSSPSMPTTPRRSAPRTATAMPSAARRSHTRIFRCRRSA
jgi:hypothetical protein